MMAAKRRCVFCHKVLRDDGFCENENCVDYARTKIHDEENGDGEKKESGAESWLK